MKKKVYYLLSLLIGIVFLLTSCERLDTPYNTVPQLSEVTIMPDSKMDLRYTLSHDGKNASSGYFEVSEYADMSASRQYYASRTGGYWKVDVDLLPSTTYYIRLVLSDYNSSVEGPVRKYTTPDITKSVSVSSVTTNSAYVSYPWTRTDCDVIFQYATNADMTGAKTLTSKRSLYSYYYATLSGLSEYKTYYVRARVQLPNGNYYYSPVAQFTTSKYVTIYTSGSSLSDYARFWIVSANSSSTGTGKTWTGYVSEPSDIYIFKPAKSASNYKAIPISYDEYDYFEYGSGKIDPSNSESVSCTMKKWQSYLVTPNISIKSTNGATSTKYISRVEIANVGSAEAISTNAYFDITTGILTPVKSNAAKWMKGTSISLSDTKTNAVNFRSLIPTKFNAGEVMVNIVLNNSNNMTTEVYPATLPASNWEQGKQYTYNITVNYTRTDVEVVVGDVTVTPWNNGGDSNIDIYD